MLEDFEIVTSCFLDFQDIIELPSKMQNPVMDLLDNGHPAQSASHNALSFMVAFLLYRMPLPGAFLIYLSTLIPAL